MDEVLDRRPVLEMRNISKSFFGVKVLDDVSVDLYPGEVLALIGENGAGKSTLIKILNGDYLEDDGTIIFDGRQVEINHPRQAEALGIRMIYQELHYAPELSVTENLLLGHLPRRSGPFGRHIIDWPGANQVARENLGLLKVEIDPQALMKDLTVVEREIIEIVKALSGKARIIVMDEPTAALTPTDVELLFQIVDNLRHQGVAIIYISHRLDEIFQVAQRVTVLRDGKLVDTCDVAEVCHADLVRMMVGREMDNKEREYVCDLEEVESCEPVLEVAGLSKFGAYQDVTLQVRPGEIVGVFGLLGAGHSQMIRSLFGAEQADSGKIFVDGKPITIKSPVDARRVGIGLVPVDRKVQGLVLDMNVRENLTLSNWKGISRNGFFQIREERARARSWIEQLGIRVAGGMEVATRFMSGGNQQKVVLGRWLEANVKVLLMNEPTWGVDVGARGDIYRLLTHLAQEGLAILMVSSDMNEVLSVSHRILTMYKGRLTGEFSHAEATQEKLLQAAAGGES